MAETDGKKQRPIVIYAAIAANLAIAAVKFLAALLTASSAMFSEGIHSLVDTGNQGLMLLGVRRSRKPPDETHPFGYGLELYFWSLIVAILLFGVGGGMGIYEGVTRLSHPGELRDPTWNYVVLGLALVFESASWTVGFHELRKESAGESLWRTMRSSKNPPNYTVVAEDSAAIAGVFFAAFGVFLGHLLESHYPDAIASILIGLTLAAVAAFLGFQSRGLLLGESVEPSVLRRIHELARAESSVLDVRRPLTMHFGPDNVLLAMDVEFQPQLSTQEVISAVDRLENAIRDAFPQIKQIYLEAEALKRRA